MSEALAKYITPQNIALIVILGVSWGTLSAQVSSQGEAFKDHEEEHAIEVAEKKAREKDVHQIQRSVDVIQTDLGHFEEKLDDQAETQSEILKILRRQYNHHQKFLMH